VREPHRLVKKSVTRARQLGSEAALRWRRSDRGLPSRGRRRGPAPARSCARTSPVTRRSTTSTQRSRRDAGQRHDRGHSAAPAGETL